MLSDKALQRYGDCSILGQGGLGNTYLARRHIDDQQVVVKEIDLESFLTDEVSAIKEELSILRENTSDYLITSYDIFHDDSLNYMYFEMEYCSGGSLADLIKQHKKNADPVSEAFACEVLAQLAYGLRDLHSLYETRGRHILVRLRPSCVLFTTNGRLKIGDPGIYSSSNCLSIRVNASLPPELHRDKRESRASSLRNCLIESADMWSLGCILLELCTLQSLTTATDLIEGMIDETMSNYTEDFRIILRMCLRKTAAERISSANLCLLPQVKHTLQRLKFNASSNTSPSSPSVFRTTSRTHRYNMIEGDTELILAAAGGHASAVQQYIGQAKAANAQKQTALMLAAMYGHSDCVALLLELEHGQYDIAGKTALMYSAENSHAGCVGLLKNIEGGLSNSMGQTALMLAAASGSEVCVHLLLANESGMKDAAGMTALMHSIIHEKLSCVDILALCEARIKNFEGETALMCAVRFSNYECVKKLAELEAGITNADGKHAVILAIEQRFLDGFKFLLEYEAMTEEACCLVFRSVMQVEEEAFYTALEAHATKYSISLGSTLKPPRSVCTNKTELMLAAEAGNVQRVTRYLEQHGQITKDGWTALMLAAYNGHLECCKLLLEEANIGAKNKPTALIHAMARNTISCAEMLYPLEKYSSKITTLMWYAYKGDVEVVVQNLKDTRKQSCIGMTALMYAAQQGHIACVQVLVDYEFKMRTRAGWTALMFAASFGNVACIWLLFGESRVENKDGKTALILATEGGHSSCLDRLCQYEHRMRDKQGYTALMYATSRSDVNAVKLLVQYESNIQDKKGRTALMIAVANNCLECIELLLSEAQLTTYKPLSFRGMFSGMSEINGTTALLIAMRSGFSNGTRLLGRLENNCTQVTPLMIAASAGNTDQVKNNISQAGNVDEIGATALMYASIAGHVACVELLLNAEASYKTDADDTALTLALKYNRIQCLTLLLEYEEKLQSSLSQSILLMAVQMDNRDCFDMLIDYYIANNRLDAQELIWKLIDAGKTNYMTSLGACALKYGRSVCQEPLQCRKRTSQSTELMMAARVGDTKTVLRYISQLGCLCEGALPMGGGTALQWAADAGHFEVAKLLLSEVGILADDGYSALLRACEKGNRELIALLMPYELGLAGVTQLIANASMGNCNSCEYILESATGTQLLCQATDSGHTALMLAARHGYEDCVLLLHKHEADLRTPKGITALMEAAVTNHADCVKILMENEGGIQNNESFTALMLAASLGHVAVVQTLAPKEQGIQTSTGTTALMFAAVNGHLECVKHLATYESCIQTELGWTALMYAASKGHADCLPLLFSETFLHNRNNQYALDVALLHNKYECFEVLQGREARIRGMTDLMLFTIRDSIDDVCLFVHLQANCKDADQCTALMYACKFGHLKCVEVLSNYEAGNTDSHGYSALMHAVEWGHLACAKAMIAHEIGLQSTNGPGPLDIAIAKGNGEMLQLINEHLSLST